MPPRVFPTWRKRHLIQSSAWHCGILCESVSAAGITGLMAGLLAASGQVCEGRRKECCLYSVCPSADTDSPQCSQSFLTKITVPSFFLSLFVDWLWKQLKEKHKTITTNHKKSPVSIPSSKGCFYYLLRQ